MSYTEYLRRKAAAQPVILNTKKFEDASMFTQKQRLAASTVFRLNGGDIGTTIEANDRSGNAHRPMSYQKQTGRSADASDYTAFLGSQGIRDDAAYNRGRLLTNSNSAGSISACVTIAAPIAPKQASQFTRQLIDCHTLHRDGTADPISDQAFVDTTIRLSAALPTMVNGGSYVNGKWTPAATTCCPAEAIHDIKDKSAYPQTPNRPSQAGGQYAVIGPNTTSPDDARKVGAPVRSDHLPYVEKHHGNDLNVNPKRPFVKYKPGGFPAHLKINEPTHYPVA
jgi:hypothetical protein